MGTNAARTASWAALILVVANGFAAAQTWTPAPVQVGPRIPGTQAYDVARGRTVLFGGAFTIHGLLLAADDTWEHDGSHWTRVATATQPSAVGSTPRMVFDFGRARMVLLGGNGSTWEYNGMDWTQRFP